MAIIFIKFNKDAETTLAYVFNEKEFSDPVDSENCSPTKEGSIEEFAAIRNLHNVKGGNEAVHVIQSWSPEESAKLTLGQVNRMGRDMAEKHFPGHQFVVVTHSNEPHYHNHIVVNSVNIETGRKIQNEKSLLYRLRDTNDEIALKNGLQVIRKEERDRSRRAPEKVQKMERFKGSSWVKDMEQKADVARAYATNYDEYSAILGALGVAVRVENKNIAYHYPGQDRGKRGDRLGAVYDKKSLEEAFHANDQKQSSRPELRALVRGLSAASLEKSSGASVHQDYSKFTPVPRGQEWAQKPTAAAVKGSFLPIEALHAARTSSIPAYLKQHGIELDTNDKGQTVLKRRKQVVIKETTWKNTKNRTQGSLIDLVAAHQNLTYLQAVSKITGNSNLLLLEHTFGEQKRKAQSFYVPTPKKLDFPEAVQRTAGFLKSMGADPRTAQSLVGSGQAVVKGNGSIVLSSLGEDKGSVEFTPESDGQWKRTKKKNTHKPFRSTSGTGDKLVIFGSSTSYLKSAGKEALTDRKRRDGWLALFEPNTQAIDHYLDKNPHVKSIEFVPQNSKQMSRTELDFFGALKSRYSQAGIGVSHSQHDLSRSEKGRGLDI